MTQLPDNFPATSEVKKNERVDNPSRRRFLNKAGIAAAGGLVVATGGNLLTGSEAKANTAPAAPPLPWKYKKLDAMEAGKRGYKNYLEKGG